MKLKIWFTTLLITGAVYCSFGQPIALKNYVVESYDEETSSLNPVERQRYVVDENKVYKALYFEFWYENDWFYETHYEYTQNDKSLLTRTAGFYTDPMTGVITEFSRFDNFYDDRNNLIRIEYNYFNPDTELWFTAVRINRVYDNNNNLIEEVRDDFDSSTGTYNSKWREVQTYYPDGKLMENITYSNEDGVWDPAFKDEYVYNNAGLLSSVLHYGSYIGSNDFGLGYKTELEYDANGLRTLLQEVAWNEDIMDWETPYYKEEYENTNTYSIIQSYSSYNGVWLPESKETVIYEEGFSGQISWPYFDTEELEFEEVEYFYNNTLRSKIQYILNEEWDDEINDYVLDGRTIFNWDDQPTSTSELLYSDFVVYPNPTNDQLHIDLKDILGHHFDVKLMNQMGQIVKQQKTSRNYITMDLSALPKGVYHANISGSGVFETKTIIKQ